MVNELASEHQQWPRCCVLMHGRSIPESHPAKVSQFATEADADIWIAEHRRRVQFEDLPSRRFHRSQSECAKEQDYKLRDTSRHSGLSRGPALRWCSIIVCVLKSRSQPTAT